ncbi:sulfate adenylyltransferase subunit 1 [Agromyces seonyuensis]|uniref:sulfate adenylyltransferase n=1 Tax=Agromyces seonyuensis TaxID=2662446 RepID=A0A6I4P2E0_9MICO|nr:GTP-binding protein [Agromyces seonyuensis]MWB99782.1 sulfate adenylyltransferase [Agromyces seonyuensis]
MTDTLTPALTALVAQPDEDAPRATSLFRFATAGSVDDGKSTLVGRLLHDAKAILADQLEQIERTSRERGFGHGTGFDFALLTDGLRAEREQGITIDVAYRYFSTGERSFVLADCPGHVQYTRNMVTGSTTADAVVVLVDARHGVLEQTRRHLAVVALLGVPHLVVAVNKIDLLGFDEDAFRRVEADALAAAAALGIPGTHVIPVSALEGDNVVERSARTPWYDGPALLDLLGSLPAAAELAPEAEPFRLPVQLVIRPQGGLAPDLAADPDAVAALRDHRALAGRVASGRIAVGDAVRVEPGGHVTRVTGIRVAGEPADEAIAPQSVSLSLADDVDAARGAHVVAVSHRVEPVREFEAELFQLDRRTLRIGDRVLVKHGTAAVPAIIAAVTAMRDLDTFELVDADRLEANEIGRVRLRLAAELPVEPYAVSREAGSFLVIEPADGATLAAGIVLPAP